ncbi:MAG: hypothetical protein IH628_18390 [Proteobacteria bacterium]|nr:hypothetical protein [Pseudomonadota bacterium]
MMALLKAAGIRSHPVLIDPGERRYPMIVDFPNNQFTHVILCVPSESDTIWLECTSQSFPVSHIGRGNDNHYALLLTEEGGKVIRTPASRSSENTQLRVGVAELQQTGNAHARVYMTYAGCQRDRVHGALDNRSPEEQQRWLIQSLDIAHGNLDHYEIGNLATRDPKFSLMLELSLPRFATSTGNRLFFYPGAMERQTWVPPESKDRRSILIVSEYAYMDSDSIVYKIPSTYTVEALPAGVQLETSFGSFASSTEPAGENLLVFRRRVEIRTPQIPAAHYDECRNFFAEVAKSDRSQVVLIRKASR